MQYAEGKVGRIFSLRLEENDMIPACIEEFAQEKGIKTGIVHIIGCLRAGDIAMGPKNESEQPPKPMMIPIDGIHEMHANGFIAPDEVGKPVLHIHGSLGRGGHTLAGCLRDGVAVWCYGEVVIIEVEGIEAKRVRDHDTGFVLLNLGSR